MQHNIVKGGWGIKERTVNFTFFLKSWSKATVHIVFGQDCRSLPNNDEIDCMYWTDSTTTLQWIQNDKHWRQYVQQRVQEIRQLTPNSLGPV